MKKRPSVQTSKRPHDDVDSWPDALEALVADLDGPLKRVIVVRETESTQDAARRMNARPGDVIIAGRQMAGRGRFGRAWHDTEDRGIAVTFVVERDTGERLAIVSAVAVAQAAELILKRGVGIKWPNDVVVNVPEVSSPFRKLAGMLIEQTDDLAIIGIGMNVLQESWPDELADKAISLKQAGAANVDRLAALRTLCRSMNVALQLDGSELLGAFTARDVLRGRRGRFRSGEREIEGLVEYVDPLHGLRVRTESGVDMLPAASTTLLDWYQ